MTKALAAPKQLTTLLPDHHWFQHMQHYRQILFAVLMVAIVLAITVFVQNFVANSVVSLNGEATVTAYVSNNCLSGISAR